MKTLTNHVILFDNECPMCYVYTKTFVKTGMLNQNGRESYQNMPTNICPLVDKQRAANEIALVDTQTGEVTYGIKSLFKVIGNAIPIFKPVFTFAPFIWVMSKFYSFISFNRKVIIPVETKDNGVQPTFKIQYRLAYLLVTWFVTAYILTDYVHLLTEFVPLRSKYREYLICGGQMLFQGIIILFYKRERLWDYLGNMMTISLAGALLLLPVLLASKYLNPIFFVLYFLMVAGLMLLEHLRRSKILGLNCLLSITWVMYRLLILGLIFNL